MVTTGAILRGNRDRLLAYAPQEHPIALQLGGDQPLDLAECAKIAEQLGFDEINLNVGCPSDRVQNGNFGACLMLRPERVAECVSAMRAVTELPVTVKHRIGVDDHDRFEHLLNFVDVVAAAGCERFTVHARKAWLQGLSPRQNRTVPPLRPEDVYRLKAERPHLQIEMNGGIRDLNSVQSILDGGLDGAMIGRGAWDQPYLFATADTRFFHSTAQPRTRREVAESYLPYIAAELQAGSSPTPVLRNLLNLHATLPGTRSWKRGLSELCQSGGSPSAMVAGIRAQLDRLDELQAAFHRP